MVVVAAAPVRVRVVDVLGAEAVVVPPVRLVDVLGAEAVVVPPAAAAASGFSTNSVTGVVATSARNSFGGPAATGSAVIGGASAASRGSATMGTTLARRRLPRAASTARWNDDRTLTTSPFSTTSR